jgi:dephospho-CoA kinase
MTQNNYGKIIGVTGITGSGTSTVSAMLEEIHGAFVIYADKLSHEAIFKGQPAYEKIVGVFGKNILNADGEINRKILGEKVFGNSEQLAALEAIIHPEVIAKTHVLLEQARGFPFAVIDAPLLIESGMYKICGSVWLVTAYDSIRVARIMLRDNIDRETATRRVNSRAGDDFLLPFANKVIENNGDIESLRRAVERNLE